MYKDAYEEGKRLVDSQSAEIDSMRQRSVQFVAFVGSATAFLVGTSLQAVSRTPPFYVLAVSATAFSIIMVASLVFVLLGLVWIKGFRRAKWNFRSSPRILVERWIEPDVGAHAEAEYYHDLAIHYDDKAKENRPWLAQLRRWYAALIVSGATGLLVWVTLFWMFV